MERIVVTVSAIDVSSSTTKTRGRKSCSWKDGASPTGTIGVFRVPLIFMSKPRCLHCNCYAIRLRVIETHFAAKPYLRKSTTQTGFSSGRTLGIFYTLRIFLLRQ